MSFIKLALLCLALEATLPLTAVRADESSSNCIEFHLGSPSEKRSRFNRMLRIFLKYDYGINRAFDAAATVNQEKICVSDTLHVEEGTQARDSELMIQQILDSGGCNLAPEDILSELAPAPLADGTVLTEEKAILYLMRFQKVGGFLPGKDLPILLAILRSSLPRNYPEYTAAVLQYVYFVSPSLHQDLLQRFPNVANLPPAQHKSRLCQSPEDAWLISKMEFQRIASSPPKELTEDLISDGLPRRISKRLDRQWIPTEETTLEKALFYLPRLLTGTIHLTLRSRLMQRVENTFEGGFRLLSGDSQGTDYLANGLLNAPTSLTDAFSDLTSLARAPFFATGRMSERIQVCTGNLLEVFDMKAYVTGLNPSTHVAVLFDHASETRDPGAGRELLLGLIEERGGVVCTPVPIYSGDSDSLAMERIACTADLFRRESSYDFMGYNCGGFTKDILETSGAGYPSLPNGGIGSLLNLSLDSRARSVRDQFLPLVNELCSNHLTQMRQIIYLLESGKELPVEWRGYLNALSRDLPARDMLLQLLISAARGKNEANRTIIRNFAVQRGIQLNDYWKHVLTQAQPNLPLATTWVTMIDGLEKEPTQWLASITPELPKAITRAYEQVQKAEEEARAMHQR